MNDIYTIGILAGMGPRSTAPFLESVLDECTSLYGAKFDDDFPHMMVYSLPTPFHPKKTLDDQKMIDALKIGIDALSNANCAIIAIPCNVVHLYYDQLCNMTQIPILNIINETIECLNPKPSKICVLGTRGTIESGLYQEQLKRKNKTIFWSEGLQEKVDELIFKIKNIGVCDEVISLWESIESIVIKEKVDEIICACTDLFFCSQYSQIKMYDSSQILASSLVKTYIKEGLKEQYK
ncbi:aspartate/glutamate racemase family protein [Bacillus toyonensis]|uniref:aspartate/glutamate racemase family protein n=1 Tax=Bacillus toyonensis TaxID=155322 RepID=UPI003465F8C1